MNGGGSAPAPHVPVLLDEVIGALAIQPGETAVDGTFGAGGYTRAMLQVGAGRVIAFDRDPEAIEAGRSLVPDSSLTLVEDRFSHMDRVLDERGIGLVDAITLDIGVSSMQLDRADRGFSFSADGPLDMRMEKSGPTAADFLNTADEAEIARVLREYGEEPRARSIARAIVANRPIERTGELAAIVRRAVGYRQAWEFLSGQGDADAFRERAIAATRQLAKRQWTWLRGEVDAPWCDPATDARRMEGLVAAFLG